MCHSLYRHCSNHNRLISLLGFVTYRVFLAIFFLKIVALDCLLVSFSEWGYFKSTQQRCDPAVDGVIIEHQTNRIAPNNGKTLID